MKTSTEIGSIRSFIGEEKTVELVAKAGFDAWDFSISEMVDYNWGTNMINPDYNHPLAGNGAYAFAKKLRKIGEDNGIRCNQSHAPFPTKCKAIRDLFKKSIELTAIAGGDICIIHPDNDLSAEKNAEMYFELLPFAKEHGVKIATENMWNWNNETNCAMSAACSDEKDFKAHLNAVNDDYLVACVDIGHAEMKGLNTNAVKMIYALKDKVQALHIHDNDKWHDTHAKPFTMSIDFAPVVKALKDIGYKGYFTLEVNNRLYIPKGETDEKVVFKAIKELYESVVKFNELYEKV